MIDGTGMYLMPGFVNLHAHLGDNNKARDAEYVYKLYLAHGVTTIRGVELAAQPFALKEKERSAKNEIVAPRIFNYQRPGAGWGKGIVDTPREGARMGAVVRRKRRRRDEARRLSAEDHGGAARRSRRSTASARRRTWSSAASRR